jgi:hypothetical protein
LAKTEWFLPHLLPATSHLEWGSLGVSGREKSKRSKARQEEGRAKKEKKETFRILSRS